MAKHSLLHKLLGDKQGDDKNFSMSDPLKSLVRENFCLYKRNPKRQGNNT